MKLRWLTVLAWALAMIASACMNEPYDKQAYETRSSPVRVRGGTPNKQQNLKVQAYNFGRPRGWTTIERVTTTATPDSFRAFGRDWYTYDVPAMTLSNDFWRPAHRGHVAQIRVVDDTGANAIVFRSDEASCYNAHSTDMQDFFATCSASTPFASITTADYDATACGTLNTPCCQGTWCDDSQQLSCVFGQCVADPGKDRIRASVDGVVRNEIFVDSGTRAYALHSSVNTTARSRIQLGAGVDRSESLLWFGDNPNTRFTSLTGQRQGTNAWANRLNDTRGTTPVRVSYPPSQIYAYDHNEIYSLTASSLPFGSTKAAGVSSVFTLDSGSCAYEVPATDILNKVADGIADKFEEEVEEADFADPDIQYQRASMYLRRMPGDVAAGGFVYTHAMEIEIDFLDNQTCYNTMSYQFALDQGVLTVAPTSHYAYTDCGGISCPAGGVGGCVGVNAGLMSEVAVQFKAEALNRQSIPIAIGADNTYQRCAAPVDCVVQNARASDTIVNLLHANTALSESERLTFALKTRDPKNWRCVDAEEDTINANVCHYVVRAERINVRPDGVELVWENTPRSSVNGVATGGVLLSAADAIARPLMCTVSRPANSAAVPYTTIAR